MSYADESLKKDKDVALAAVRSERRAIKHVDDSIKDEIIKELGL